MSSIASRISDDGLPSLQSLPRHHAVPDQRKSASDLEIVDHSSFYKDIPQAHRQFRNVPFAGSEFAQKTSFRLFRCDLESFIEGPARQLHAMSGIEDQEGLPNRVATMLFNAIVPDRALYAAANSPSVFMTRASSASKLRP